MKEYTHNTGTFVGKGGIEIFFQSWTAAKPKAVLVIAHGLGEHSGRYGNIIDRLKGAGISIYALEHRGHGRSGGKRGHIDSFMDYIYDLKLYMNFVKDDNRKLPLILLGHSLGGLIALKYALTYPEDMNALALSSAAVIPSVEVPAWKSAMGRFMSKHAPGLLMRSGLDANDLSHDADVVKTYCEDPMVHDRVSARFYTEAVDTGVECLGRASELKMPLLIIHGKNDAIVDYRGSEQVFEKASTPMKAKEIVVFPDLYHETMNETEKERKQVLDVVARWIIARVGAKKAPVKKAPAKKAAAKPAKAAAPAKKAVQPAKKKPPKVKK